MVVVTDSASTKSSYRNLKEKQNQQKEKFNLAKQQMISKKQEEDEWLEHQKHQRRRANEDMIFYEPPLLEHAVVPRILDGDNIMFVGHLNVLYGSLQPYGFINLFEEKIFEWGFKNVTIRSIGATSDMMLPLDVNWSSVQWNGDALTKVIIVLGNEIFESLVDDNLGYDDGIIIIKRNVERVIATFVREKVHVILGTLFLSGEKYDSTNPNDVLFEDWQSIFRRISATYQNVSYVDFTPAIQKYWESRNLDNVDHAILTHDGKLLNEEGHALVACQILQTLSLMDKPFVEDITPTDLIEHSNFFAKNIKFLNESVIGKRTIYDSLLWGKLVERKTAQQRRKDMEEVWLQSLGNKEIQHR